MFTIMCLLGGRAAYSQELGYLWPEAVDLPELNFQAIAVACHGCEKLSSGPFQEHLANCLLSHGFGPSLTYLNLYY